MGWQRGGAARLYLRFHYIKHNSVKVAVMPDMCAIGLGMFIESVGNVPRNNTRKALPIGAIPR